MADVMQFSLVSPERQIAALSASAAEIPGSSGDLTAMPGHAPMLTTLRPGLVRVSAGGQVSDFVVSGGFVEIGPEATSVLAERAMPRAEASREIVDEIVAEAEAMLEATADEAFRAAAAQRVADARALYAALGF